MTSKKNKRRDMILEKASGLFTNRGFSDTSLEDIAAAVGIKRESLYYYYPGKYDLLYDIIEPQISRTLQGFDEVVTGEGPWRLIMEKAIENHLRSFNPSYFHMAMAVRKNSKGDVEQKFIRLRDQFKQYEKDWIKLMEQACEAGEIRTDIPPRMLAFSVLGLCNSLSSWYRPDGDLSLDQVGRYYMNILFDGMSIP